MVDYPRGPLAESATVQRMKLLVRLDQPEAVRTAEAYLASYPNGFARNEASRIARAGYVP